MKLQEKVNTMNYKKGFKRFAILFVLFIALAGIGTGIRFRNQIPNIRNQIVEEHKEHNKEENKEHDVEWEDRIQLSDSDKLYFIGLAAVFSILLGLYWLYTVAYAVSKSNQMGFNPYIFGLLTLLTNLFGVAILWIWISIHPVCPSCNKRQKIFAEYCVNCGTSIHKRCPACNHKVSNHDIYCGGCGKKLVE